MLIPLAALVSGSAVAHPGIGRSGGTGAVARSGGAAGVSRPGDAAAVSRPGVTLLATTHGTIPRFAAPGGPRTGRVPGSWHHAPSTLPVIATRAGWLDVRLAQRPNGSTAWVRASGVSLGATAYAIVIDLRATRLTLYRDGRRVFSAPAGVGAAGVPTPAGHFFVAFIASPPAPDYGPFVMVTSAHSTAISDWDSSGDAMVGIHGPLGAGAVIGRTGARISHGCIRLHDRDLARLSDVPAGTPVTIVSS
ncbi:MAG: L,D-transpeptidase [Actinobacteria bacterium]|nr:L,D-transpeptidase [Actinomycetota bacterium]MBO0784569.1 L,D-transpeptidase [Actinomycetota bacterium]